MEEGKEGECEGEYSPISTHCYTLWRGMGVKGGRRKGELRGRGARGQEGEGEGRVRGRGRGIMGEGKL
jgi:hypothetical protein